MNLTVDVLPALEDNYIYALSDANGRVAVIDPGEPDPVWKFLSATGRRLSLILCTHHHWDHVDGVSALLARDSVPVICSAYDLGRVPGATRGMADGETFDLLGAEARAIAVPGHTLGQNCYYLPKQDALFVGDTLFSCGCGRLFEGDYVQLFASLAKIKTLPASTRLYFGHEYTLRNIQFVRELGGETSALVEHEKVAHRLRDSGRPTSPGELATELAINPFLKANNIADLQRWREARNVWKSRKS